MNGVLRRLLLLPVLLPLVAVAALALLNPRPAVALRLLTWTSPALPIGSWLAIAVGGGGLLSAAATTAALQTPTSGGRRQVRVSGAPRGREAAREPEPVRRSGGWADRAPDSSAPAATAGPQRPPGAPPPTVEVPFRVIRKGSGASAKTSSRDKPGTPAPATAPVANAVGDGWGESPSDEW